MITEGKYTKHKLLTNRISKQDRILTRSNINSNAQVLLGPPRVKPGRLSVSRTFGDIEAKVPAYGGNPKVVIAIPEIIQFTIESQYDFIVLGWDGIFDKVPNHMIIKRIWSTVEKNVETEDFHTIIGASTDNILKDWVKNKSLDNLTWVIIWFKNLKKAFQNITNKTKFTNTDESPIELKLDQNCNFAMNKRQYNLLTEVKEIESTQSDANTPKLSKIDKMNNITGIIEEEKWSTNECIKSE